ncbi:MULTISPECIES: hypothetical protein [unclassified Modicisalibacter]|uniref:hypothetical protein n=1 Tax=unclassified Modicisalibacter TaxID=2679913 RepID=UPI001CCD06AC|nr:MULTISPECIES: hypothetical protein [unclassified Modicisalibacter]MBZ9559205.1 hypothetical protein [Modicisalibacter sp. R2A 31.J]MBZ9576630.1 hypothetical protein [Modicisalibacter sp. MOD 31.J]
MFGLTVFPRFPYFLVLALIPLFAMAEEGSAPETDDWQAANCPGALPVEGVSSPYASRIEHYAKTENQDKYVEMAAKHGRYLRCNIAVVSGLAIPVGHYRSYQMYMKAGAVETAERMSLESILEKAKDQYDPNGPIYPILEKEYREAYSEKMASMAESSPDKAKELMLKKYFCECLSVPWRRFEKD